MTDGKKLGRLGALLDAEDFTALKESANRPKQIQCEAIKASHLQEIHTFQEEKDETGQEKKNRGNPSSSVILSKIRELLFIMSQVVICLTGEFIFARWVIEPFGLGHWETFFMSLAMVLIMMKGIDFCFSSLEAKWPQHLTIVNLVVGGVGFILVFLLIYMASDIRGLMFQVTNIVRNTTSSEEIVNGTRTFFKGALHPFVLLMMILTAAITLIGGSAYHRFMAQLFPLLQLRRLDKRRKQIDREILKRARAIAGIESELAEFQAEIQLGYCEEKARKSQATTASQFAPGTQIKSFGVKLAPLLIIGALLCFFLLSGIARGDNVTFLDMSISSKVRDYTGRVTEFQKNVDGIEKLLDRMPPGEQYRIYGITGKTFSSPYTMLEGKITKEKGAFGELLAQSRLDAVTRWRKLNLKPFAGSTDIFGAIHLASVLLSDSRSKQKCLVLFSDMRQSTKAFDFEPFSELNVETLLGQAKQKKMIPSLDGVKVWCLGVHASGKTPAYWYSIKRFWEDYFRLANVSKLCAFTMERELNLEEF